MNRLLLALACWFCLAAQGAAVEDHLFGMVHGKAFTGHAGTVHSVAFLPGQQHRLVSIGDDDKTVRLWQPVNGELLSTVEFGFRPVDMVVSRDGSQVDVLLTTGNIRQVRVQGDTLTDETSVQDRVGRYGRMAVSPAETFYAVASRSDDVTVWNARTRRLHQSYLGSADFRAISFAASDNVIIAADNTNGLVMWDILANEGFGARETFTVPGEANGLVPMDMSYHRGTSQLAVTHLDGRISLWHVGSGLNLEHRRTMRLPQSVFEPMFSPYGTLLYVACLDGNVFLFETASGKIAKGFQGNPAGLYSLALNRHGNLLAAGTLDGGIIVWWTPQQAQP